MRAVRSWVSGIVLVTGSMALPLQGRAQQEASDTTKSLEARVDELDQQVRILQRLRELAAESTTTAAKDRQSATANGKDGFSLKSADGKYTLKIRGYIHADGRFFLSDDAKAIPNTFFLRRARPIIEASVGKYFDFRIMPDFGQGTATLFDAYWEGKFARRSPCARASSSRRSGSSGSSRPPTSPLPSAGLPTNLAPNRDVGLQIGGDVSEGCSPIRSGSSTASPTSATATVTATTRRTWPRACTSSRSRPARSRVSASASRAAPARSRAPATAHHAWPAIGARRSRPSSAIAAMLVAPENSVIAEGRRSRVSPHAYLGLGSLGLLGEYIVSSQEVRRGTASAKLNHKAWQASAGYFLTGEQAGFRSPTPKKPFDLKEGHFGALEIAARYGELDLDDDAFPTFANPASAVSKAKAVGVGLNWHLNKQIKVVVNYEHTTFEGGGADGDRASEDFVVTRFQHAF